MTVATTPPPGASPASWSVEELATLAAIAETFVRGAATRRANLAAAALDLAAELAPGRA